MQTRTKKKIDPIKVRLVPNLDPTSAKLIVDQNGEDLATVIKANHFGYYQFQVNGDQIGISKFGRYWRVVPSKMENDKSYNWYVEKLSWCMKHKANVNFKTSELNIILNKFIKRTELKIFE